MNEAIQPEIQYYATLNRLFGITTVTVIFLCLLCLPFFSLDNQGATLYTQVLGASAIFTIVKYVWMRPYISYDRGFYITDILNPIMTGLLIIASGRYGMFLFSLFFLQILGSLALFRFKHVLVSISAIATCTVHIFFISDSMQIGQPESYIAGLIILVVLFLTLIFSYFIVHEQVRVITNLNIQKSKFIQDVSHELRTPLTVIKGVSTLLTDNFWFHSSEQKKKDSDNKLFEYLKSAAVDLETITERLSTQSRDKVSAPEHSKPIDTVSKKKEKVKKTDKKG